MKYTDYLSLDGEFHKIRVAYIAKLSELMRDVIMDVCGEDDSYSYLTEEALTDHLNEIDLRPLEHEFCGPLTDIMFSYIELCGFIDIDTMDDGTLSSRIYEAIQRIYEN